LREKFAAAGRFPVVFQKRSRPSDSEVLTMRLVDRVLRPLFQMITMLKFKDDPINVL
jgi:polyribonucleotide nucleotidyltransferase